MEGNWSIQYETVLVHCKCSLSFISYCTDVSVTGWHPSLALTLLFSLPPVWTENSPYQTDVINWMVAFGHSERVEPGDSIRIHEPLSSFTKRTSFWELDSPRVVRSDCLLFTIHTTVMPPQWVRMQCFFLGIEPTADEEQDPHFLGMRVKIICPYDWSDLSDRLCGFSICSQVLWFSSL